MEARDLVRFMKARFAAAALLMVVGLAGSMLGSVVRARQVEPPAAAPARTWVRNGEIVCRQLADLLRSTRNAAETADVPPAEGCILTAQPLPAFPLQRVLYGMWEVRVMFGETPAIVYVHPRSLVLDTGL